MDVYTRYRYDSTFNYIVDQLRYALKKCHMTPGELREAAILAATMHEAEVMPRYYLAKPTDGMYSIRNDYYPYYDWNSNAWYYNISYIDLFKSKPVECNCTKDLGKDAPPTFKCICDCTPHTKTCNDYNWAYYHQVDTLAKHTFGKVQGFGDQTYRPCLRCNLSDVFIKHFKVTECLASSPTKS